MGFEILYQYRENTSSENGQSELQKTGSVKVGSPYEEVSLNVLAGKVFALMARRNVFVANVEVYEIVKKPIAFKESEDGIIIKNKKFRFDDGPAVEGEEVASGSPEDAVQALLTLHPELKALLQNVQGKGLSPLEGGMPQAAKHPHELSPPARPATDKPPAQAETRYEFYEPDNEYFVTQAKTAYPDLTFTRGKRYPIISEHKRQIASMAGAMAMGQFYETLDDKGKKVIVSSNLFVPNKVRLLGDENPAADSGLVDAGLVWSGDEKQAVMPEVRKRQ